MGISSWKAEWAELRRLLVAAGATGRWAVGSKKPPRCKIGPPATEEQIRALESKLHARIPKSLRRVIKDFSSRVRIEWEFPEGVRLPGKLEPIFAGECRWDLRALPKLQRTNRKWIEEVFTGKSTPDFPDKESHPKSIAYDLVWHNKFAFLEVGNGDMLGIDVADKRDQPVIYLSHEGGSSHGFRLGQSFEDYIDRLTALAFVGSEDWQLEVFLTDAKSGLKTKGKPYDVWRRWLDRAAQKL
jgi:cell wall assembly regulator SMI1